MAQTGYWTEGTNIGGTNVGGGQFVSGVAPVGSKPVNTTFDGSALGNTPTLTVPKPTPTITQNPTIGVPSGAVMGADGFVTLPPQPENKTITTPEEDNRSFIQKLFKKKMDILDTQPEVTKQIQEEEQTKQKRESSISSYNAYNKANVEFNQQLQAMQNAAANTVGGVGGGYSSTIQKFEQEGRAKLANMAIQANMDQNNYQGALQNVKEKLDAQFKPVQDSIDNIVKFSQINANDLTDKEKFQLQSQVDQKKTELSNINKTVESLHESMLQNNAPQSVYSSVDKIVADYSAGKITAQDAQSKMYQAVGTYGVDATKVLEQKKLEAEIASLPGGQNIDVTKVSPEGKAILSSVKNLRFSTVAEGNRIIGNITERIASGDIEGAKDNLKNFGYQKLSGAQKSDFDLYEGGISAATSALSQIADQNVKTGPYKTLLENKKPYLAIKTDEKYIDLRSIIELGQAQIRKGFYGTAVTGTEAANARQFLVVDSDNIDTIKYKLQNQAQFLQFVNDATIARTTGLSKPNLDDYLTYRVKDKASGKTGVLPRSEYDSNNYELIQ